MGFLLLPTGASCGLAIDVREPKDLDQHVLSDRIYYSFGYAIWGRLVSPFYAGSQTSHIRTKKPRHLTYEDVKFYEDLFLKHIAQSLAELSIGDVYLVVGDDVTPDNRSWDTETAWGGEQDV